MSTTLARQTGTGLLLRAGQVLTVTDPQGGQVSDLFCFSADDHEEKLSGGRTIDYANTIFLTTGHVLYSNRSAPMLTVVEDTCGHHDFLLTPCSQETFDLLYPEFHGAPHPSCFANLVGALGPHGVDPDRIGTTLNVFMDVWTDADGELHIDPPPTRPGDRFSLEARVPVLVGATACSAEKSNNGVCTPIDHRVERAG